MSQGNPEIVAVYPGSFDPLTLGHADIVRRACRIVDRLIVAVAETSTERKQGMFEIPERVELIEAVHGDEPGVKVTSFSGLLVDFARDQGARIIIRGLRAVSDFEYEFQMAQMNRSLWDEIETIFMAPDNRYTFLSASLVREVGRLGGDVSEYVPDAVLDRIVEKVGPTARGQ
jgi:pantetheine-phosphate adenylyltransferase